MSLKKKTAQELKELSAQSWKNGNKIRNITVALLAMTIVFILFNLYLYMTTSKEVDDTIVTEPDAVTKPDVIDSEATEQNAVVYDSAETDIIEPANNEPVQDEQDVVEPTADESNLTDRASNTEVDKIDVIVQKRDDSVETTE